MDEKFIGKNADCEPGKRLTLLFKDHDKLEARCKGMDTTMAQANELYIHFGASAIQVVCEHQGSETTQIGPFTVVRPKTKYTGVNLCRACLVKAQMHAEEVAGVFNDWIALYDEHDNKRNG